MLQEKCTSLVTELYRSIAVFGGRGSTKHQQGIRNKSLAKDKHFGHFETPREFQTHPSNASIYPYTIYIHTHTHIYSSCLQ
jgi:hypothetical protein